LVRYTHALNKTVRKLARHLGDIPLPGQADRQDDGLIIRNKAVANLLVQHIVHGKVVNEERLLAIKDRIANFYPDARGRN
jgi:hypothetical protein